MQRPDFDLMAERLRSWGRWGPDDQLGTLNHITPAALVRAGGAVRAGKSFTLGLPFDRTGPQEGGLRFNPMLYVTQIDAQLNPNHPGFVFQDDVVHMPLQCATQWDALCHVHYDGLLYNGCKACDVLGSHGAASHGIEHMAARGIVSRGVLLDIARLKGADRLPGSCAITPGELDAACARQGVSIEPGDIVLIRTGHIRALTLERDRSAFRTQPQPGLTPDCAEWLHDRAVAAVAADNMAVEHLGPEMYAGDEVPLPMHMLCLRDMGMPLGEMFDLEALAADCAADGQSTFLFSAPPLGVTGAAGSPVNPIALK